MLRASGLLFLFAVVALAASTPMDKVITLLTKLMDQIEEEGKKEAVTYEKYSCFCKHESDFKTAAIDKSKKRIEELDAEIDALTSEIGALTAKAATLKDDIGTKETEIANDKDARTQEFETYSAKRKDLAAAVKAIEKALETMRLNKAKVEGGAAAFLTTKSVIERLPASLSSISEVKALKQAPKAYEYSADDVIAVLVKLSTDFKKKLADLDKEEATKKFDSDMKISAMVNTKTAMESEKVETETSTAAKTELMNEQVGVKTQEKKEMDADQAFLDDMTAKCEAKAKAWDERSKTRAAEIKAISEALPELKKAAGVYGVNTKLVDSALISKHQAKKVSPHRVAAAPQTPASVAFLQFSSEQSGTQSKQLKALADQLSQKARVLSSAPLALLAAKLSTMGPDHFVKVRGIIKDLINKLEADAAAEATQKGMCDKEMKASTNKRDEAKTTIEAKTAVIDTAEAKIKELNADIVEKSQEIADSNKYKKEMTDLRAMEKKENEETINTAKAAVDDLTTALNILNTFYGSKTGFAQLQASPSPKDRADATFEDKAPETFEGKYEGKVASAGGIIGILEVIKSDFQRTFDTTTAAEEKAVKDYENEIKQVDEVIDADVAAKGTLEGTLSTTTDELSTAKDDLKDAEDKLALAQEELSKLEASCIAGEESYEERVAHRKQEIAALKEALQILEDWKGL